MKIKVIESMISVEEARKNPSESFMWIRPNKKFGAAMDTVGGWGVVSSGQFAGMFPAAFTLAKFGSEHDTATTTCGDTLLKGERMITGSYLANTNCSFYSTNIAALTKEFFKLTKTNIILLRKYSPEQMKAIKKLAKDEPLPMIVGEYHPFYKQPGVKHVFMSDTYTYYKDKDDKVVEYEGFIPPKPVKATKFSKDDIVTALEFVGAAYADKQAIEKKSEFSKAKAEADKAKRQLKDHGAYLKRSEDQAALFKEAHKLMSGKLTPARQKILDQFKRDYENEFRSTKATVLTHAQKYKSSLALLKKGAPKAEEYGIGEKLIKKEIAKIGKYIESKYIEQMEYDPVKGIKITFPPMEYKSSQKGGRFFLGRPVVLIHNPTTCLKGSACGTIRFTLPSFAYGQAATDHFGNANGANMDDCGQGGQCLGGGDNSYWSIFGPLIASRRFGELIPHLRKYILEHNRESPNGAPQTGQRFEVDAQFNAKLSPQGLKDDSFSKYLLMLKEGKATEEKDAYQEYCGDCDRPLDDCSCEECSNCGSRSCEGC